MFACPNDLMDGADDFVAAERRDHPLDLPPVAEARDIAVVAAALCTDRRFVPCVIAKALDQFGSIGECVSAMDEGAVHAYLLAARRFPTADDRRQRLVSHLLPWPSAASSAIAHHHAEFDPRRGMLPHPLPARRLHLRAIDPKSAEGCADWFGHR